MVDLIIKYLFAVNMVILILSSVVLHIYYLPQNSLV